MRERYIIDTPNGAGKIAVVFHMFNVWQHEDVPIVRKILGHLIFSIFTVGFTSSVIAGAITSPSKDQSLFLFATGVSSGVILFKLTNIRWNKETILSFLRDNCSHSLTNESDFMCVHKKLNKFMNFVVFFLVMLTIGAIFISILPVFRIEKTLPLDIGFPLNWKDNNFIYVMAYTFLIISIIYCVVSTLLNITIWYLMMNYSIKYEILGFRLRDLGAPPKPTTLQAYKVLQRETRNSFNLDLIELVQVHRTIQRNVDEFKSFFYYLFFVQIMTSSVCICGSAYVLAFTSYETMIQFAIYVVCMMYHLFDIFMLMYFGNDIKLTSNRLSYCLFKSNWLEQSKSTKKNLIILTEILQQPHELMICKLYPLDLQTFTSILRLAYSTFSILRNI